MNKLIECAVEHGDHELHDKLLESRKRKALEADITEAPTARVKRSQEGDFQLKNHCLFCAKVCEPINPKHPDMWERRGIKDAAHFKDAVLQYCGG